MTPPDLLQRLLTTPGPPGYEDAPARIWREAAEAVLQSCESLAPFLRADAVRAQWSSALRGRGSRRRRRRR